MTGNMKPLAELTSEAIALLSRELGTADTIRFINQFTNGFGDYTAERDLRFDSLSLDDITSAIQGSAADENA